MPIASGGMATVYLARAVGSSGFATEVALKLTHEHLRTSAEFANDLVDEAKLAARIRHRNVVSVLDVADDATGLYLVMEYIDGDTLAGLCRGPTRIPVPMAVRLLVDALGGLHAAHEVRDDDGTLVGVVHRDFTPQNILVGTDGVARLADFGIAKAATRLGHTRTGIVKGKISYMSPEQAHGTPLDRRCDVWAAGVVAWEIFAGRRLHGHEDDIAVLLRVATVRPPLLRTVVPDLPEPIEAAVAKALTMEVEGRHATAQVFARELAAACRDTVGVAEVDEVAAWMATHVAPKVSSRRMQVAQARALRDATQATRAEGSGRSRGAVLSQPSVAAASSDEASGARVSASRVSASTAFVTPPPATQLTPTIAQEQETRLLTDGVSVVARKLRSSRALRPATRGLLAAGAAVLLAVGGITVWRVSLSRSPGSPEATTASTTGDTTPPRPTTTATAGSTSAGTPGTAGAPGGTAPVKTTLRLHANAVIASVRVNDRALPVTRPGTTVSLQLVGFETASSLAIDAFSADGRRAEIAVPAGATDVTLDFPASSSPPAVRGWGRVRVQASPAPAPAPAPTAPATAPLAPSPY
ncbi:MAG: serine/threonine-protein kinase, partial [Polyangiaceae bacterium]